ncbi:MAG: hypothetical protein K0R89_609 [Ramlibacter sp.]|jgi:hypothetical protein|nr:hypothetical protein [Ramlibacter sp.]
MLIQLITQHPEAIGTILRNTPPWVGGLLVALVALGSTQLRDRRAGLVRVSVMPVAITAFSLWGTVSAFAGSSLLPQVLALWAAAALVAGAPVAVMRVDAQYDPATRSYALRGSVVPLLLILAIFLVKYVVGVELAIAPRLVHDAPYVLTVGGLYGAFSGIFIGRAARLWRLALRSPVPAAAAAA